MVSLEAGDLDKGNPRLECHPEECGEEIPHLCERTVTDSLGEWNYLGNDPKTQKTQLS